jgi:hypothetical protein
MNEREWVLLFSDYDLRAVLDNQLKRVSDEVLKIDHRRFQTESDELLAALLASKLVVAPLELHFDDVSVDHADIKKDISNDFDRVVFDRSRPTYVDGTRVTYHVPFSGDAKLLRCRPSSYTLNPPRAVIGDRVLRFPYDRSDREITATKRDFEEDLGRLKQWLPWVNQQVEECNASLEVKSQRFVQQRRSDLNKTKEDVASLGFKVRGTEAAPVQKAATEPLAELRKRSRDKAKRVYDVALSFAGEDRDYVEKVAENLKTMGITVFYDRFEQVDLWGKDLAEHLGEVYGKDSRFVVLFLSKAYATKAWPNHEKQFAMGRRLSGEKERILPVRFDDTEIAGLPMTVGYLDLRALTPQKLTELIRQKVDSDERDA